jgi:hypothetical protein
MEKEFVLPTPPPDPQEVAAILATPETPDELKDLSQEEQVIVNRLLPIVADRANRQAEANKAKELDRIVVELRASNEKAINAELEKMRAANKPLEPDELEKLLSQEYLRFTIKVPINGNGGKEFIIGELPQSAELRFYRAAQKTIVPALKTLSSMEWSSAMSMADKLQQIVEVIPEALTVLAELCVVALDPFKKEAKTINVSWVQDNLSSNRIMHIVEAQVTAGRFRDFISAGSRLFPGMTTTR